MLASQPHLHVRESDRCDALRGLFPRPPDAKARRRRSRRRNFRSAGEGRQGRLQGEEQEAEIGPEGQGEEAPCRSSQAVRPERGIHRVVERGRWRRRPRWDKEGRQTQGCIAVAVRGFVTRQPVHGGPASATRGRGGVVDAVATAGGSRVAARGWEACRHRQLVFPVSAHEHSRPYYLLSRSDTSRVDPQARGHETDPRGAQPPRLL